MKFRWIKNAILSAAVFIGWPLFGQNTVTMTAAHLGGSSAVNGVITFQPVLNDGTAASIRLGGGGIQGRQPITVAVVAGAYSLAGFPSVDASRPLNVCYSATVRSNTGLQVLGEGFTCLQPMQNSPAANPWCVSGVCNLDNYVPTLANGIAYIPGITGSVANSYKGAWSLNAIYNSGDIVSSVGSLYMCSFNGNTAFGPFGANVGPGTQWSVFLPGIAGPTGTTGIAGPAGATSASSLGLYLSDTNGGGSVFVLASVGGTLTVSLVTGGIPTGSSSSASVPFVDPGTGSARTLTVNNGNLVIN